MLCLTRGQASDKGELRRLEMAEMQGIEGENEEQQDEKGCLKGEFFGQKI